MSVHTATPVNPPRALAARAVAIDDWIVSFSGAWSAQDTMVVIGHRDASGRLTITIRDAVQTYATIIIASDDTFALRTETLYIGIAPLQKLIDIS